MQQEELQGVLEFLRSAERMKTFHRSAWTSAGQPESVAEHTWRLCLMAVVLEESFPDLDVARLLRMCIVHDLGEAIRGDVPAVDQKAGESKAGQERADLMTLLAPLPDGTRTRIAALWDEYEAAQSPEARVAKALDKLETILQHNQGANPPDFDYRFNLGYGRRFTEADPVFAAIRAILDRDTASRAAAKE